MTLMEVFPVGVVISLIAAALLRDSRFLPARPMIVQRDERSATQAGRRNSAPPDTAPSARE